MLHLLSASLLIVSSLGGTCGWVDVGSTTIRLDSCYVQCNEVTEECWDQKFYCNDEDKLMLEFYRDSEDDCGGTSIGVVEIPESDTSIEDYDCEGTAETCVTFTYNGELIDPETGSCDFSQVKVELVAEAFFTGSDGKYFRQNCDDERTVTRCDDEAGTLNCIETEKNILGLDGDYCMKGGCVNEQTGEQVGNALFITGTHKYKYINYLNPSNWTVVMWTVALIIVLLLIVICFQYKIYRNTTKNQNDYRLVKTMSDSEEMEKLQ